jgi:hypothetical protein
VLSVLGAETQPLWVEVAAFLRSSVPHVEERVVDGVGHLLHVQGPEPVARAMAEFPGGTLHGRRLSGEERESITTVGRLWGGRVVPRDGSGGLADHAASVRTWSAESAGGPQLSQHRSSPTTSAQR